MNVIIIGAVVVVLGMKQGRLMGVWLGMKQDCSVLVLYGGGSVGDEAGLFNISTVGMGLGMNRDSSV